jgi:hypothetical protein
MTCGNYQSYGFDIKQWYLVTTKKIKLFNDILHPLWSTPTTGAINNIYFLKIISNNEIIKIELLSTYFVPFF